MTHNEVPSLNVSGMRMQEQVSQLGLKGGRLLAMDYGRIKHLKSYGWMVCTNISWFKVKLCFICKEPSTYRKWWLSSNCWCNQSELHTEISFSAQFVLRFIWHQLVELHSMTFISNRLWNHWWRYSTLSTISTIPSKHISLGFEGFVELPCFHRQVRLMFFFFVHLEQETDWVMNAKQNSKHWRHLVQPLNLFCD